MQNKFDKINPIMVKVSELNVLKQNLLFIKNELKEYDINIEGEYSEEQFKQDLNSFLKSSNGNFKNPSEILFEHKKISNLFLQYQNLKQDIEGLEKKEISGHKVGKIQEIYAKAVMSALATELRKERKGIDVYENEPIEEDDLKILEELGMSENIDDFLDKKNTNESIIEQAKKYRIFLRMRKSLEKGFFLSFREAKIFEEMLENMKNQKPILLTGDTGSGKTELAKYISRHFLKNRKDIEEKEALFIGGSKSLETEDFTVQKIIEYTSDIMESSISDGKEENIEQIADKLIDFLNKSKELKNLIKKKAEESKNTDLLKELENNDIFKPSLTTKYHLMALLSGIKQGLPVIIDEANTIRPEVLMSLNDLFTKTSKEGNNEVQLPNGLKPIKVKEGFCIILTGNDPEDNKKADNYKAGRYEFDPAFYNRLSVYAKGYLNQSLEDKFDENNEDDKSEFLEEIENLNKNELFQFILMYLYNGKDNTNNISGNKHGFSVFKKGSKGEYLNKGDFFDEIKDFARGVSMIQKLFAKEEITLEKYAGKNLSSMINRKVFSMRNMLDVLDNYKKDNMSLEYSIYKKFIKNTSSKEEKEAVLMVFQEVGFFNNYGDINTTITALDAKYADITNEIQITSKDYEKNSFIISKEDMYKKLFLTFGIEDDVLKEEKEKNIYNNDDDDNEEIKKEYSQEEIEGLREGIINSLPDLQEDIDEKVSDVNLILKMNNFILATKEVIENEENDFSGEELNELNELINSLLNGEDEEIIKLHFENYSEGCRE